MSQTLLIVLSVLLAVVVVAVLAAALIVVRRSLERTSAGLATLASALDGVESQHLRPLEESVNAINAQFDDHPRGAAGHRPQGLGGGGQEADVTLWWIADALLVLVVLPVVIYLLFGVLTAARSITPSVDQITLRLGRRIQGSGRRAAAPDDQGAGFADCCRSRQLRRLARRDHRRRLRRE